MLSFKISARSNRKDFSRMKAIQVSLLLLVLTACQAPKTNQPNPSSPGSASPLPLITPTSSPAPVGSFLSASLDGSQESPEVITAGVGFVSASLNAEKTELSIKGVVSGLSGALTKAELGQGAPGKEGTVLKSLSIDKNKISLIWKRDDTEQPLSSEKVDALLKGEFYLNLQTEKQTKGEIRGQLQVTAEQVIPFVLEGAQEVPSVESGAHGVAWVRVSEDQSRLALQGHFVNLSGPATAAHIHFGIKGTNGEALKAVKITGNQLSLSWSRTDTEQPFTAARLQDLQQGNYYLNLHTHAYPAGELRGQISQ
ncbi:hypothetical protein COW36_05300 [bacterium (Candidatus Blackallbacteria) CG17_big_fil_post_rev_8_21_14_2_50_48_46]|uniref:CHRD domain-containing protein n=1 Tax=bacterium (Candidatus Blackallbacteria) CG17_big_fil_post_rev_8_21_14_2_50_48_46 TaxID=2014261 RepID=A0A2M7G9C9_9BACT|nr:MAG: hypothetical protein COW64_03640 [bacterium (Candidatus Blackallbacteria) CG18_big_fil_WC_8_21_14_2_50_49_26]PIW18713.1 MAG: hypothetical protein COW36_05300 [bacterium (Candidatus Blackallbacteria) CG17_big_fil_post_rev_8_21_14_2_50_48_46]PIW46301.1 MAG: hypothetical protein COW20_15380 [bacterium (Candidatus Blackallbacteria) CG13_big_fil_rev_8_21_14_2_50_49_14]